MSAGNGFDAETLHREGIGLVVLGVAVEPLPDRGQTGTVYWSGSNGGVSVGVAYTPMEPLPWVVRRSYWAGKTHPESVYRGEAMTLAEAIARVEMDEDIQRDPSLIGLAVAS